MNKLLSFVLVIMLTSGAIYGQTIDELKKERDETSAQQADLQGQADALAGEVAGLSDQIIKLTGWRTGLNGTLGLNFNNNDKWQGNSNKSSAFNVGLTAFANQDKEKFFWNNKAIATKAWQDVDKTDDVEDDGLFDASNSAADVVNISSLYGYKLSENFAISALGEINTTVADFFGAGGLDFGVGATWTPINNLVVVIHPLNFFSPFVGEISGAAGAKIRADYTNSFPVAGKSINLSSTFTTFQPYSTKDGETSLSQWQWLNNLNFTIWKGIGVGVGLGLRNAEFEIDDTQLYTTFGLSYGF